MANEGSNSNQPAHTYASGENLTEENRTWMIPGSVLGWKHHQFISLHWTPEEQAILEQGLVQFVSESLLSQYTKIVAQLNDKTVRDVALRVGWMIKNENDKRKMNDHNSKKKRKYKKEIIYDPSAESSHSALLSRSNTCYEGPISELLEQNAQNLSQISANLAALRIQDNINLFYQTRNNLLEVMNEFSEEPEDMKKMPPLPVLRS